LMSRSGGIPVSSSGNTWEFIHHLVLRVGIITQLVDSGSRLSLHFHFDTDSITTWRCHNNGFLLALYHCSMLLHPIHSQDEINSSGSQNNWVYFKSYPLRNILVEGLQ
jgi:hypothetical protein